MTEKPSEFLWPSGTAVGSWLVLQISQWSLLDWIAVICMIGGLLVSIAQLYLRWRAAKIRHSNPDP